MVFKTKRYKWNYSHGVAAETVGEELERIESAHGEVTPKLLLDASRAEESPTHGLFTWDDSVAAEKYRLYEAGRVICDLHVEYEVQESDPKSITLDITKKCISSRAFVNVADAGKNIKGHGSFVNLGAALENEELAANVIKNAKRELRIFTEKYEMYSDLSAIVEQIKAFLEGEAS